MALDEEDFSCICGAEFDNMEQLTEHWKTNTAATTGRPHYRFVKIAGSYEFPPEKQVKDGPQL
jgi:hypothetical protein